MELTQEEIKYLNKIQKYHNLIRNGKFIKYFNNKRKKNKEYEIIYSIILYCLQKNNLVLNLVKHAYKRKHLILVNEFFNLNNIEKKTPIKVNNNKLFSMIDDTETLKKIIISLYSFIKNVNKIEDNEDIQKKVINLNEFLLKYKNLYEQILKEFYKKFLKEINNFKNFLIEIDKQISLNNIIKNTIERSNELDIEKFKNSLTLFYENLNYFIDELYKEMITSVQNALLLFLRNIYEKKKISSNNAKGEISLKNNKFIFQLKVTRVYNKISFKRYLEILISNTNNEIETSLNQKQQKENYNIVIVLSQNSKELLFSSFYVS